MEHLMDARRCPVMATPTQQHGPATMGLLLNKVRYAGCL